MCVLALQKQPGSSQHFTSDMQQDSTISQRSPGCKDVMTGHKSSLGSQGFLPFLILHYRKFQGASKGCYLFARKATLPRDADLLTL